MNPATPTDRPARPPLRWLRRLAALAGILFVLGVIGIVGLRWWLGRYLHSESFRRLISTQTANALQADGEFLPLHWTGNAAYTDGFAARGRAESLLQNVRADQIRAEVDVTGLLQPSWRISHLEIQRLNATIQKPHTGSTPAPTPAVVDSASTRRVTLGPIGIQEANLNWLMNPAVTGSVRRVQARIELTAEGWQTTGSGGDLVVSGWPGLKIDQFRLRSRAGTIYVTESQLRLLDGGALELSGQVPTDSTAAFDMQVRFADVPVKNWLPADWRGAMSGRANGRARLRGHAASLDALVVTGQVSVTGAKLEALPVLDRIALFTQTEQFRSVQLQKASADVEWQGNRLTIRSLFLESAGLLRIEGGGVVQDEMLDGEFDVGVAATSLQWLPGSRTQVFTVERDGYLWTKVKVRGPLKNLEEDLSGRLMAAAGKEVFETGKGLIEQGAKTFFDLLKKAPGL